MWIIQDIELTNVGSHRNTVRKFTPKITNQVIGLNLKALELEKKIRSNGSGKSFMFEAPRLLLIGDTVKNLRIKEIIFNGEERATITGTLKNEFLKKEMKITREFFIANHKPSTCSIEINGEPITKGSDINEKNQIILSELGISKSDLCNNFLISKDYKSFFVMSDKEQQGILNKYSKADKVDKMLVSVELDIANKETDIQKYKKAELECHTKVQVFEQQILDESDRTKIEERRQSTIQNINQSIDVEKERIENIQNQIKELNRINSNKVLEKGTWKYSKDFDSLVQSTESKQKIELDKGTKLKEQFDLGFPELDEQKKSIESNLATIVKDILFYKKRISSLKAWSEKLHRELNESIHCPKCSHFFQLKNPLWNHKIAKSRIEQIERVIISREEIIAEYREFEGKAHLDWDAIKLQILEKRSKIEEQLVAVREAYKVLSVNIAQLQAQKKNEDNNLQNIEMIISENDIAIERFNATIESYKRQVLILKQNIEDEKVRDYGKDVSRYSEEISKLNHELDSVSNAIEEEEEQLTQFKFTLGIFQKFKTHLANKSLDSISQMSNYFLAQLNSPFRLVIDGYKTLSNKKVKEDITFYILRDGVTKEPIEKLSLGELAMCDLSVLFAFQQLINSSSETGGLDYVGIDEVIVNALDGTGLEEILYLLNSLDKTIDIITHGRINGTYPNTILITKDKKGVSSIATESFDMILNNYLK